ncbi:HAD family hydrolase [marine bacterium AO1-C]|nr:HAD family hydrolase [marine bacterium AO1-C]
MKKLKVVAFDADDTLWINEPLFQQTERRFCDMLEDFLPHHTISQELLKTEIQNLKHYGYGTKSFMLSMIETAISISGKAIGVELIEKIIALGKEQLNAPVEILTGIPEVLDQLHGKYKLIMATKGDLLEQERKLKRSGLEHYFHHVEIVSEKNEAEYERIIKHLDIAPENFLMIGNSLKSDVVPVLNIGGYGFHIPYHTTWEYEKIDIKIENPKFRQLENIAEVLKYIV